MIVDRPIVLCWLLAELWRIFPQQPNEPALPAVHRRSFVLPIAEQ